MKLASKIILGLVATNFIYVLLSSFIFFSAQPIRHDSTVLSQDLLPMLAQASQVQYAMAREGFMIEEYSSSTDPEILVGALIHNADVVKYLGLLEENIKDSPALQSPEISSALASVRGHYQQFRDLAEALPSRITAINTDLENVVYDHEKLSAAVAECLRREEAAFARNEERISKLRSLESFGFSLIVATFRGRYADAGEFSSGLELAGEAEKLAAELSAGEADRQLAALTGIVRDMGQHLAALQTSMETAAEESRQRGQLADAAIEQAAGLAKTADRLSQKVAGDSTNTLVRMIWSLAIGVAVALLLSAIMAITVTRSITRPINNLIGRLSEGAQGVDQAAGQLSGSADGLASGARDNAGSLQNISSALEELSAMTKRNTDNSREANTLMNQATDAVSRAEDSMGRVIGAMDEISASGAEIAKIIKTIDEIAFQTNLLALNAAVEAARAGEAGAGFAVVADEVRNLATRSAEAARNTADLIAATIKNIQSGSEMVGLTAESFKTVEGHSGRVAGLLSEVAEASSEQSQGIENINRSMLDMDKVTQSNASSADESAHSARGLSDQAADLLSAVDELTALVYGPGHSSEPT